VGAGGAQGGGGGGALAGAEERLISHTGGVEVVEGASCRFGCPIDPVSNLQTEAGYRVVPIPRPWNLAFSSVLGAVGVARLAALAG
jgi:hypothetical protein